MGRWQGGVRLRTAIAVAVVVGVAGLVAAVGFVRATESILTHNVDSTARQRAAEVTAGMQDDEASDVIEMLFGAGRDDCAAFAAAKPAVHPPGAVWSYSSGTTNMISWLPPAPSSTSMIIVSATPGRPSTAA